MHLTTLEFDVLSFVPAPGNVDINAPMGWVAGTLQPPVSTSHPRYPSFRQVRADYRPRQRRACAAMCGTKRPAQRAGRPAGGTGVLVCRSLASDARQTIALWRWSEPQGGAMAAWRCVGPKQVRPSAAMGDDLPGLQASTCEALGQPGFTGPVTEQQPRQRGRAGQSGNEPAPWSRRTSTRG
jgi:hypothetical protein